MNGHLKLINEQPIKTSYQLSLLENHNHTLNKFEELPLDFTILKECFKNPRVVREEILADRCLPEPVSRKPC